MVLFLQIMPIVFVAIYNSICTYLGRQGCIIFIGNCSHSSYIDMTFHLIPVFLIDNVPKFCFFILFLKLLLDFVWILFRMCLVMLSCLNVWKFQEKAFSRSSPKNSPLVNFCFSSFQNSLIHLLLFHPLFSFEIFLKLWPFEWHIWNVPLKLTFLF